MMQPRANRSSPSQLMFLSIQPQRLAQIVEDAVVIVVHPLPDNGNGNGTGDNGQVEHAAEKRLVAHSGRSTMAELTHSEKAQVTGTDTMTMMKVFFRAPRKILSANSSL